MALSVRQPARCSEGATGAPFLYHVLVVVHAVALVIVHVTALVVVHITALVVVHAVTLMQ